MNPTDATPTAAALAASIASHLPGWAVVPPREEGDSWYSRLVNADGASLFLGMRRHEWRLSVSCEWPSIPGRDCRADMDRFKITLSPDRPPAKLAADISRRLFGVYLPEFARMLKLQADTLAREAQSRRLAEDLAVILGEPARAPYGDDSRGWSVRYYAGGDDPSFDLHVQPYGSVKFEVNIPADSPGAGAGYNARRLARYLAALVAPFRTRAVALAAREEEDAPDPGAEAEELRRAGLDSRGRP